MAINLDGNKSNAKKNSEREAPTMYLNISIEVAEGVFVNMPINCPIVLETKGQSLAQQALMRAFVDKIENATCEQDLEIKRNIVGKLYRKPDENQVKSISSDWLPL